MNEPERRLLALVSRAILELHQARRIGDYAQPRVAAYGPSPGEQLRAELQTAIHDTRRLVGE